MRANNANRVPAANVRHHVPVSGRPSGHPDKVATSISFGPDFRWMRRAAAQVVKFGVNLRGVAVLRRKRSRRYNFANTALLYVVDIPRNDDVSGHFGRTA